ncbi:MAG: SBBP repeat-containing protein, partial [candidate division WOR-3 bacterium]
MKLSSLSSRVLCPGLMLLALASTLHAQVQVWKSEYSAGGSTSKGVRIALSPDSSVVVAATCDDITARRRLVLMKLSRDNGDTLWARYWSGDSACDSSRAEALAVDDSGNVFVAGIIARGFDWNWVTFKYLPNGALAWAVPYDNGGFDRPYAILPDNRGGVYVAGTSNSAAGWLDALVVRYDPAGDSLWSFRLNGPGNGRDHLRALARGPNGSIYAAGNMYQSAEQDWDLLTIMLDSLGDTIWTRTYDGTSSGNPLIEGDVCFGIATDKTGNCYVTGKAGEAGEWLNAVAIKYTPDGTQAWRYSFDWGNAGSEVASHIELDSFGNVYVGGCVDEGDGWDMLVYSLSQDSAPTLRWKRRFNYVNAGDDDSLTGMVADLSGNVYLTGLSNTTNLDLEWWTLKLSPQGDTIWSVTNGRLDTDNSPYGLVLDDRGDVYVTGYETPSTSQPEQTVTIRYTENDVGVLRIAMPADSFRLGATVTPRAWVRNYGGMTERSFTVRLDIGSLYTDAENVDSIPAFDSVLVRFAALRIEERALGTHPMVCYTMLT